MRNVMLGGPAGADGVAWEEEEEEMGWAVMVRSFSGSSELEALGRVVAGMVDTRSWR